MRSVERWLMKRCQSLVTSWPGLLTQYFLPVHGRLPHVILVEQRSPRPPGYGREHPEIPPPFPWRTGCFTVIHGPSEPCDPRRDHQNGPGLDDLIIAGLPPKPFSAMSTPPSPAFQALLSCSGRLRR